mgnify:CR=1 FL=1
MYYISELAYASHIAQVSKSTRDKRQKNKYQQSELLASDVTNDIDSEASILMRHASTTMWQGKNRRAGNDRREMNLNRGRYLESRSSKDRRYSTELYVKT